MTAHAHTFDSARRVAELLVRVQERAPKPFALQPLVEEWGVSWQSVRRAASVLEDVVGANPGAGRLMREGRGAAAALRWVPSGEPTRARVNRTQIMGLATALGPWEAAGVGDVADVLRELLRAASSGERGARAEVVRDLMSRGFYYQPWMPRRLRDPDVVDTVLTALFFQEAIQIEAYHAPAGVRGPVTVEPWTLLHAMDGLYVVGRIRTERAPMIWALHRMSGVTRVRGVQVVVPDGYDPRDLLGHGYGPFLAKPGRVQVRVPTAEAPWVLESPLPRQEGEPEWLPDGSALVTLGVGMHPGLRLWARAMGVEVLDAPSAP